MGAERGELPLWAVLFVAAGVLVLGLRGSHSVDAQGDGDDWLADAERAVSGQRAAGMGRDLVGRAGGAGFAAGLAGGPGGLAALVGELVMPQLIESARQNMPQPSSDEASQPGGGRDGLSLAEGAGETVEPSDVTGDLTGTDLPGPSLHPRRGPLLEEGGYLRGIRHGEWTTHHPDGSLAARGRYENGLRDGTWESYGEDGLLLSQVGYEDGSRHGDWLQYGQDGVLLGEGQNDNSDPVGRWTRYYSNGRVKERGMYVNGLRHGVWEFYDDLGAPTSQAGEYLAGIKID